MRVNLNKTIRAMALALDLAEKSSIKDKDIVERVSNVNYSEHEFANHSRRVAYIAMSLSKFINFNLDEKNALYISALLHDIGASKGLKQSHNSDAFIKEHCVLGSSILELFPMFNNMSNVILYHHENYNGSGPMGLKGDEIPLQSQLIRMADLVELLYEENIHSFKQKNLIISWVKSNTNKIFSKDLVDMFVSAASKDMFWFDMENISIMDNILDRVSPNLDINLDLAQFESIAHTFSNIIDTKSNFTARHSRDIAELAYKISSYLNYPEEKCLKMKIAGLFHDIGKLAIPSSILDKNGPLDCEEFSIIKSHAYYTSIILDSLDSAKEISTWASNHHEKMNGTGYPNGLTSPELSEESRIIAVCDIYQALTEDRPYRKGMSQKEAFAILDKMVEESNLCSKAVSYLKSALTNQHN
ncbi:cyclic di-GMP phosphodiesterase response regulator RpfG [Clostridium homopropionicum DSM 5847]|uniref:Cyclic di-GMP phosphodiesterase response regulator RpfG n=1 Tax=Clostridium homopropionicum DSM 5847 TaxID=1121318 RepID=A0A0L6Z5T7_9CLOT|nr:HD-GYP domain-containing protein [Clostridium homopropionicum]KOA18329.1 cyclic di-GMP phosphodiesterase response regulator RpfG [Clostridium homopropionicum DSM 5847]SFF69079.1 HD domain-containing protein [Clostridium homopropionicum]